MRMIRTIIGQRELEEDLKKHIRVFPTRVVEETRIVLDKMVDTAKILVRKDTWSLCKSIRRESYARPAGCFLQMGFRAGGYIVNPKTGRLVDYAIYQEFGTSRMPGGYPYMRPAADRHEPELISRLERVGLW